MAKWSGTANEALNVIAEALEQLESISGSGVFADQPNYENYQGERFEKRQDYIDSLTGLMWDALNYVEMLTGASSDRPPF